MLCIGPSIKAVGMFSLMAIFTPYPPHVYKGLHFKEPFLMEVYKLGISPLESADVGNLDPLPPKNGRHPLWTDPYLNVYASYYRPVLESNFTNQRVCRIYTDCLMYIYVVANVYWRQKYTFASNFKLTTRPFFVPPLFLV